MKIAPKRNGRFIVAFLGIILTNRLDAQKLLLEAPDTNVYSFTKESSIQESSFKNVSVIQPGIFPGLAMGLDRDNRIRPLDANYYEKNIGLFCKMEWSFEKYTHLPLRFRLGSLDYVNHLEGK